MDVEAEAGFKLFASGSAGGSFSVSGTYPISLDPSTAETSFSFSFGLAAMAGGSMHSSVTASLDESSGDAESDTDEYLKVDVDNSMQASGKAGFSFQVGFSTEDLNDDGEYDPSEDIAEFGLASDTGSGIGLDTIESPQPASDFTGMQFSMGVTASSKQSDSLSFGEKVRSEDYLTKTRDEISIENSSSSKSDFDFSLSHGTEDSSFSLASSGSGNSSDVNSLDHQYIDSDTEANGTDLPAIYDNKESFDGSSGYSFTFELTLGDEDGVTGTVESSWEAAVDVLSEEKWNTGNGDYIIRYEEEYRDGSEDDPETEDDDRIHLITETTIFEDYTTVEIRQGSIASSQVTQTPASTDDGSTSFDGGTAHSEYSPHHESEWYEGSWNPWAWWGFRELPNWIAGYTPESGSAPVVPTVDQDGLPTNGPLRTGSMGTYFGQSYSEAGHVAASHVDAVMSGVTANAAMSGLGAFGRAVPRRSPNFAKKVRKHIDQVRKRLKGHIDDIPSPGRGGLERVWEIITDRVAQGGGVRTTYAGEDVISYVDGGVSYIFRLNGEFWTILRN